MAKDPTLGILLAAVGCCFSAGGYTFQKMAHRRASAAPGSRFFNYWQFYAGAAMLLVGSGFAVVVFGLAGQAELAPMGAVTMVVSTLLSWVVLHEPFSRADATAVGLMGCGTSVALAFAEKQSRDFDIDSVVSLLTRSVVWVATSFVGSALAMASYKAAQLGAVPTAELSRKDASLDAFCRGFAAGVVGGYTGTCAKATVETLLFPFFRGELASLFRLEPYLFACCLALCVGYQLHFLNTGLARHDASRVIPIYQSTLIIANVLAGLIYWNEMELQSSRSLSLFAVGCCLTISGQMVLLTKPRSPTELQSGESPANAGGDAATDFAAAAAAVAAVEMAFAGDSDEEETAHLSGAGPGSPPPSRPYPWRWGGLVRQGTPAAALSPPVVGGARFGAYSNIATSAAAMAVRSPVAEYYFEDELDSVAGSGGLPAPASPAAPPPGQAGSAAARGDGANSRPPSRSSRPGASLRESGEEAGAQGLLPSQLQQQQQWEAGDNRPRSRSGKPPLGAPLQQDRSTSMHQLTEGDEDSGGRAPSPVQLLEGTAPRGGRPLPGLGGGADRQVVVAVRPPPGFSGSRGDGGAQAAPALPHQVRQKTMLLPASPLPLTSPLTLPPK